MNKASLSMGEWGDRPSRLRQWVRRVFGGLPLWVVLVLSMNANGREVIGAPCLSDTVGIDPSLGTKSSGAVNGDCPGESFVTSDTLMEFLRVWRTPSEAQFGIGMHLYVMGMGANGTPYQGSIIVDGPTIVHTDGDGLHPTEFKWTWDPPLVLPHAGGYAFFVTEDPCIGFFDILASDNPALYAAGNMYLTKQGCVLGPNQTVDIVSYPQYDVVFQVGFCRDDVTPTRHRTWGELKLLYR